MRMRFDPHEGLIYVSTRIVGPDGDAIAQLALDTGATTSMINSETLGLLGYDTTATTDRIYVTTGSGVEFIPRIRIQQIEALGVRRDNHTVLCHTLPPRATVDGLLGLDFFEDLRLVVDFRNGFVDIE